MKRSRSINMSRMRKHPRLKPALLLSVLSITACEQEPPFRNPVAVPSYLNEDDCEERHGFGDCETIYVPEDSSTYAYLNRYNGSLTRMDMLDDDDIDIDIDLHKKKLSKTSSFNKNSNTSSRNGFGSNSSSYSASSSGWGG